jgi:hypothetical protein
MLNGSTKGDVYTAKFIIDGKLKTLPICDHNGSNINSMNTSSSTRARDNAKELISLLIANSEKNNPLRPNLN